jgi:hypothetical protein
VQKSKGKGKSRMEQFKEATHRHPIIVPALSLDDGIAAVRAFLPLGKAATTPATCPSSSVTISLHCRYRRTRRSVGVAAGQ